MKTRIFLGIFLFLAIFLPCSAQQYPAKPIRIVVPFPVGGIAAEMVAKSPPDGYTLVMGSLGTHAVNVRLFSKLPYDPVRDFAPVALALEAEGLLVVHPCVPAQSVPELIALARSKPGALTCASAGAGTASHLAAQTSLLFGTMPTVLPHAKAGKLRALATIGTARSAVAPELPTVAESLPGFEVNNWVGLFAPAGTPPDIVGKLNGEVQKFMQSKEITARLTAEGVRFIPMTPEQFGAFVKSEIAKWAPVVKASGARAE